jgi:hypothetical protein
MEHRHFYRIKWFSFAGLFWRLECECGEGCYLDHWAWKFAEDELELVFK